MITKSVRLPRGAALIGALLAVLIFTFASQPARALAAVESPVYVVVTIPYGVKAPANFLSDLAARQKSRQVSEVIWIDARPDPTAAPFSAVATLEFPNEATYQAWDAKASTLLPAGGVARRVALLTHGENRPRNKSKTIFYVEVHVPLVSTERMREYGEGYIAPLMNGQRDAGALESFSMFLQEDSVGGGPFSFIITEYNILTDHKDVETFSASTNYMKEPVRVGLAGRHPVYTRFSDDKVKYSVRDKVKAFQEKKVNNKFLGYYRDISK